MELDWIKCENCAWEDCRVKGLIGRCYCTWTEDGEEMLIPTSDLEPCGMCYKCGELFRIKVGNYCSNCGAKIEPRKAAWIASRCSRNIAGSMCEWTSYVCDQCGYETGRSDHKKCPNCFSEMVEIIK